LREFSLGGRQKSQKFNLNQEDYCVRRALSPMSDEPRPLKSPSPEFDAYLKYMANRKWTTWQHVEVGTADKVELVN
jgi:hypothetical protein